MSLILLQTGAHIVLETARDTPVPLLLPPERWPVYILLAALSLSGALFRHSAAVRSQAPWITLGSACAIVALLAATDAAQRVVLYVTSGVIGTILMLQFGCSQASCSVAQGKRMFGAMAAGGVLGATLCHRRCHLLRFVSAQSLLMVGAVTFLAAALIVTAVPTEEETMPHPTPVSPFAWLKDISPCARIAAADRHAGGVSTAAVLITDYLFKSMAAEAWGP
jgi:hypothetical protein